METIFCGSCGAKQSVDWRPGSFCRQCGGQVRDEIRCGWCCKWTIKGKFCRYCGFEVQDSQLFGVVRMLKHAGIDQISLPMRCRDLEPEQVDHYQTLYNQQYTILVQRIEEIEFLQSYLVSGAHSPDLEEELIQRLPLPQETLKSWSDDRAHVSPDDPFEYVSVISRKSPFERTRLLAQIALFKLATPAFLYDHANQIMEDALGWLDNSPIMGVEIFGLFSHWKMWTAEAGMHILPDELAALLVSRGVKLLEELSAPLDIHVALTLLRCHWTTPLEQEIIHKCSVIAEQGLASKSKTIRLSTALTLMHSDTLLAAIGSEHNWLGETILRILAYADSDDLLPFISGADGNQLICILDSLIQNDEKPSHAFQAKIVRRLDKNDLALSMMIIHALCLDSQIEDAACESIHQAAVVQQCPTFLRGLIDLSPDSDHGPTYELLGSVLWNASLLPVMLQCNRVALSHTTLERVLATIAEQLNRQDVDGLGDSACDFLRNQITAYKTANLSLEAALGSLLGLVMDIWDGSCPMDDDWFCFLVEHYADDLRQYLDGHPDMSRRFLPQFFTRITPRHAHIHGDASRIAVGLFGGGDGKLSPFLREIENASEISTDAIAWIKELAQEQALPVSIITALLIQSKERKILNDNDIKNIVRYQGDFGGETCLAIIRLLVPWALDEADPQTAGSASECLMNLQYFGDERLENLSTWLSVIYSHAPETFWDLIVKGLKAKVYLPFTHWLTDKVLYDLVSSKEIDSTAIPADFLNDFIAEMPHFMTILVGANADAANKAGYLAADLIPDTSGHFTTWANQLIRQPFVNDLFNGVDTFWDRLLIRWVKAQPSDCIGFVAKKLMDDIEDIHFTLLSRFICTNDDIHHVIDHAEPEAIKTLIDMSLNTATRPSRGIEAKPLWRSGRVIELLERGLGVLARQDGSRLAMEHLPALIGQDHAQSPYREIVTALHDNLQHLAGQLAGNDKLIGTVMQFLSSELESSLGFDFRSQAESFICDLLATVQQAELRLPKEFIQPLLEMHAGGRLDSPFDGALSDFVAAV